MHAAACQPPSGRGMLSRDSITGVAVPLVSSCPTLVQTAGLHTWKPGSTEAHNMHVGVLLLISSQVYCSV